MVCRGGWEVGRRGILSRKKEGSGAVKAAFAFFAFVLVFVALCLSFGLVTVRGIFSFSLSETPTAAFLVTLSLFLFNCAAGVVPLGVLYLACGYVLSPRRALCMCVFGSALCFAAFYCEGRRRGKCRTVLIFSPPEGGRRTLFAAFFLHCVRLFPSRAAGLCLGAAGLPFWAYLAGSLLGALPTILFSLSLARSLTRPNSALLFCLTAAALSYLAVFHLTKRR